MMVQGKKILGASLFAATSFLTLQSASHAAVFAEVGDAGQTLATGQSTSSAAAPAGTALTVITGAFGTGADADLFVIRITSPGTFSATTNNALTNGSFLDTAIFLFDSTGRAIATNDDAAGGTTLSSTLPAGNTLLTTLSVGTYYLGISGSGNEPVNLVNSLLFAGYPGGDTTAVRGPAGSINPTTLSTFNGNVSFSQAASYEIDLTGAATAANPAVPEPSSWAALALGSIAAGSTILRRRSGRA